MKSDTMKLKRCWRKYFNYRLLSECSTQKELEKVPFFVLYIHKKEAIMSLIREDIIQNIFVGFYLILIKK